jgi:hypothetical protein
MLSLFLKKQVIAWMTSMLTALAPADRAIEAEDQSARSARIEQIAADIVDVVYDPNEKPIFGGKWQRERTAATVAVFAAEESVNFAPSVDQGLTRGDTGRSWCIMQMNIGTKKTSEGWTGPDLIKDRKKCIRAGLHALRRSYWTCSQNREDERFAAYASGRCDRGQTLVRRRSARVDWTLFKIRPTFETNDTAF